MLCKSENRNCARLHDSTSRPPQYLNGTLDVTASPIPKPPSSISLIGEPRNGRVRNQSRLCCCGTTTTTKSRSLEVRPYTKSSDILLDGGDLWLDLRSLVLYTLKEFLFMFSLMTDSLLKLRYNRPRIYSSCLVKNLNHCRPLKILSHCVNL